jgi:hypothetical protein
METIRVDTLCLPPLYSQWEREDSEKACCPGEKRLPPRAAFKKRLMPPALREENQMTALNVLTQIHHLVFAS